MAGYYANRSCYAEQKMCELACLRKRCVRLRIGKLAYRFRRQASSHIREAVYRLHAAHSGNTRCRLPRSMRRGHRTC
ncbi:hypothetical protein FPT15_06550 [Pseudomonas sp. RGB]|nr:hypothetical protein FPT15_06550 [Pseudomonas sp. RGB]